MKPETRREYFSIPNLLGYFRILLLPFYLYIYVTAETTADYYLAAFLMVLSFLSDLLDGKIARRFNMVTEFGKILDPVADKLTQGVLALSFAIRYPAITVLFIVFIIKELIQGIMGLVFIRKFDFRMNGAQMHGKVCTCVLDAVMLILLLLPNIKYMYVTYLTFVTIAVMVYSFCRYMVMYWKVYREKRVK